MKTKVRLILFFTSIIAVLAISACEDEVESDPFKYLVPGIYDSSNPPQLLGALVSEFEDGAEVYYVTKNNYSMRRELETGNFNLVLHRHPILFTGPNHTGDMYIMDSLLFVNEIPDHRVIYNPKDGGTLLIMDLDSNGNKITKDPTSALPPNTSFPSYWVFDGTVLNEPFFYEYSEWLRYFIKVKLTTLTELGHPETFKVPLINYKR